MRRRLIPVIILLALLVFIALFLDNSVFIIRDVHISGDSGMDETDVVRLAGINMGGRMRDMNVESIARNVDKSGVLKCVNIETELPSAIVITVERRQGRAVTDYGGSVVLMDGDGYVISLTREIPEGEYLYMTGLSPRDAAPGRLIGADTLRIDAVKTVINAIDRTGAGEFISELNVENTDSIYLYSRTGIQVMLGDANDMESKLIWMKYALMDLESRGETSGRLDVTSGKQADFREY